MTITRRDADTFAVVTDTLLADGSYRSDDCMELRGHVLHSREQRGHLRIGGLLRVTLGPVTLPQVQALRIGETFYQGRR